MPGTIQVSILEFVGLPSLVQSSSMGIKVSLGKQAQETQDKGDFFFPLASLRDNMNVTICDSEGNEIANAVVETRSIVEKGIWDDLFALQGGGHVHMRLHFILTEDEQNRIRSMRESAARKKQEHLLKRRYSSSDITAVASGGSRASSQPTLETTNEAEEQHMNLAEHQTNKISGESNAKVIGKDHPVQKNQAFSTSKSTGALDKLVVHNRVKEVTQPQDQEQQSPLVRTPSNVRKIARAFESTPAKEPLPASNETRSTPQLNSSTTAIDVPSKAPSVKKRNAMKAKVVFSSIETAPAPSIAEGIRKGRGESEGSRDRIQEAKTILSNLEIASAPSIPEGKLERQEEAEELRDPFQGAEPVSSNLDMAPASSVPVEMQKGRAEIKDLGDPFEGPKPVSSNLEMAPAPSMAEGIQKGTGKIKDLGDSLRGAKPTLPNLETTTAPSVREVLSGGRGEMEGFRDPLEGAKPILSNLETASASSMLGEIQKRRAVFEDFGDPLQGAKPILSNLEMAPAPSMPGGLQKGRRIFKDVRDPFRGAKPVLHNLETAPAPSVREGTHEGRGEMESFRDPFERAKPVLSSLETAPALSVRKGIRKGRGTMEEFGEPFQGAKPIFSNLETSVPSVQEGIHRGGGVKDFGDSLEGAKPDLSLETTPAPSIPEGIGKGRGKINNFGNAVQEKLGQKTLQFKELRIQFIDQMSNQDNMSEMQPAKEENKDEKSSLKNVRTSSTYERRKYSWDTLLQAFPRRKQSAIKLVTEQKWRSKHWKSSQHRKKSKVCHEEKYHSSDSFRGWIFLDENTCSCTRQDDRPTVELLEGCRCSPDTSQGQLADAGVTPSDQGGQGSYQSKKQESTSMPNNGSHSGPTGQVVKIAIMVGFGVLVFLTRQRT